VRDVLLVGALVLLMIALMGMTLSALDGRVPGWGSLPGPMMGRPAATAESVEEVIPGAAEVEIRAVEFGFLPSQIRLRAGQPVNLTLVNAGLLTHDLWIPDLGIRLMASPGERTSTGLQVEEPGVYLFECSIGGHAEAGMTGRLVVVDQ
jgi:uncharacterized cupredoxin-like copper-binding protein